MRTLLCCLVLLSVAAGEPPVPAAPFCDGAVLQAGLPVPVWGTASPGEQVTVAFAGQTLVTTADAGGRWRVDIAPLTAAAVGAELRIGGAHGGTVVRDIVVGEVWLCGGQSNMNRGVDPADQGAADPLLRQFRAAPGKRASWKASSGGKDFSGCAFHFASRLRGDLGVPVGILVGAVDGSPIEPFLTGAGLAGDPELALLAERMAPASAGKHWQTLFQPLAPFAARGVVWYQGESNGLAGQGAEYAHLLRALVRGWRLAWGRDDLPMLVVQLPGFISQPERAALREPGGDDGWTRIREAQWQVGATMPGVTTIVSIDIGDPSDIHPGNKPEVGRRLALTAAARVYGKQIPWRGPVLRGQRIAGERIHLVFDHADGGLLAAPGSLRGAGPASSGAGVDGFAIAGADARWHDAEAVIAGPDAVEVRCPAIAAPVAVRYAWRQSPGGRLLYNRLGLPCAPFRTDRGLTPPAP